MNTLTQYCLKILKFFCLTMLFTTPSAFAINNEPSTDQASWLVVNGLPYWIERDGNYHDSQIGTNNQYYRFGTALFNLNLQVTGAPPGTPVVSFTDPQTRNLISHTIEAVMNPAMNVDFSIAPNGQSRAIAVDFEDLPPDAIPAYAMGIAAHIPQNLLNMNDPVQALMYNRYNQNGGMMLFRNMLQTNLLHWNNYQYLIHNNIIPPDTTLRTYAEMSLVYTIAHEFTHLLGAVHGQVPAADWMIEAGQPAYANPNDMAYQMNVATLAGSGRVAYMVPIGQAPNWRPSLIAPSYRSIPQNLHTTTADNYFITLHNYLGRPVTTADIQPALQDSNIMLCFRNFYPQQQGGRPLNGPNIFCPVNTAQNGIEIGEPLFAHVDNDIVSLLRVGIMQENGVFMDVVSAFPR